MTRSIMRPLAAAALVLALGLSSGTAFARGGGNGGGAGGNEGGGGQTWVDPAFLVAKPAPSRQPGSTVPDPQRDPPRQSRAAADGTVCGYHDAANPNVVYCYRLARR